MIALRGGHDPSELSPTIHSRMVVFRLLYDWAEAPMFKALFFVWLPWGLLTGALDQPEDEEEDELAGVPFFGLAAATGTVATVATTLAYALLVSLVTDHGQGIDPTFYVVLASILPLLTIAGLVELRVTYPGAEGIGYPSAEEDPGKDDDVPVIGGIFRFELNRLITSLAVGEGVALYAIAERESTTFLAVAALVAAGHQLGAIAGTHVERYEMFEEQLIRARKRASGSQSANSHD